MSDSIFNPDAMLDTNYEEAPADHYTPIDEGEYMLRIKDVKPRKISNAAGEEFFLADINFVVLDEQVQQKLNMKEPVARMGLFLDMTPQGTLDFGTNKNVKIGQLRKACGIKEGKRWSLRDLWDRQCYGKIRQRQDKNDPERIYSEVTSVTREPTIETEGRRPARSGTA